MNRLVVLLSLIMFACGLGWWADYLAHDTLADAARFLIGAFTFSVVTGGVLILTATGFILVERVRIARARRMEAQRDAQLMITVAAPGSQVYASEVNGVLSIKHRPLHLAPGTVNGEAYAPDPIDLQKWLAFQRLQSINHTGKVEVNQLTEGVQQALPQNVDLGPYIAAGSTLHRLFLGVGRFADGRVDNVIAPMEGLIHVAAGGASGFGKSTFIQALVYQVLNARERPDVILLDPQAVTFTPFAGHDRILYQANRPGDIADVLAALVAEMERREQLFARWRGIQNLSQYNAVVEQTERLAALPVFFDEFGLVADNKDIARLARLLSAGGRKAGLALFVSTQHWGTDSLSSAFRANLNSSIQFKARDKTESRILLGDSSAADLQKPGQALARLPGQAGLIELQAPDPSGVIDTTPELLPEGIDLLVGLKDRLDGDNNEQRTNEDTFFAELVHNGKSRRQAAIEAYGREYAGDIVTRGKRALGELK